MVISYKYKCIFIHNPKLAGTSISTTLYNLSTPTIVLTARWGNRNAPTSPLYCTQTTLQGQKHITCEDLRDSLYQDNFGKEIYDDFYKFAYVRSPWTKMVSFYFWIRDISQGPRKRQAAGKTFDQFVRESYARYNRNRYIDYMMPQHIWTHIGGEQAVDFIGRFENLNEDFDIIKQATGMPKGVKLPFQNTSTRAKPYYEYYNDETAAMVGEMFKEDILLYGYKYGDGASSGILHGGKHGRRRTN